MALNGLNKEKIGTGKRKQDGAWVRVKTLYFTGDTTPLSAPSGALQLLGGEVACGNFSFMGLH